MLHSQRRDDGVFAVGVDCATGSRGPKDGDKDFNDLDWQRREPEAHAPAALAQRIKTAESRCVLQKRIRSRKLLHI